MKNDNPRPKLLPNPLAEMRDPYVIFGEEGIRPAFVELERVLRNPERREAYCVYVRALHDCAALSDEQIESTVLEVSQSGLIEQNELNDRLDPHVLRRILRSPDVLEYLCESVASSDSPHWCDTSIDELVARIDDSAADAKRNENPPEDDAVACRIGRKVSSKVEPPAANEGAKSRSENVVHWKIAAAALLFVSLCGAGYGVSELRRLNDDLAKSNLRGATEFRGLRFSKYREVIVEADADPRYISHAEVSVTRDDGTTFDGAHSLEPNVHTPGATNGKIEWRSKPLPDGAWTVHLVFRPKPEFDPAANPNALFLEEGYFSKEKTHFDQRLGVGPSGVMMLPDEDALFVHVPREPIRVRSQEPYGIDVESTQSGAVVVFVRAKAAPYWSKQHPRQFLAGQKAGIECYFGRGPDSPDQLKFQVVAQLYKEVSDIPAGLQFVDLPDSDFQSEKRELTVVFAE